MSDSDEEADAQPVFPDRGVDENEMTEKWLPDEDDWLVKTHFDRGDASAYASVMALIAANPKCELGVLVQPVLDDFMRALVSENAKGFEAYQRAIEAVQGASPGDEEGRTITNLVAANPED